MSSSIPDFVERAKRAVSKIPEEDRLKHALESFRFGECKSLRQAAQDWQVCRYKLQRRAKGGHSVAENGGNNTKLTSAEELALFAWANLKLSTGP